jgi:hypothetical protein
MLIRHRRGAEMALEAERRFFRQRRAELLRHHEGKFALVHGEELVGVFSTFDDAYAHGIARFGRQLFLVEQISPAKPLAHLPSRYAWLVSDLKDPPST